VSVYATVLTLKGYEHPPDRRDPDVKPDGKFEIYLCTTGYAPGWLRVSVFDDLGEAVLVLDPDQVRAVRDKLAQVLADS
jgi:hypothetical protein